MYCNACGAHNTPDSQFCANCGSKLAKAEIRSPSPAPPPVSIAAPLAYSPPYSSSHDPILEVERMRRFAAEQRSFTTPAVITLVLYVVLWLPGLIANIVYLRDAKQVERVTGRAPEGMGCLWALLAVAIAPVLLLCLILAF